MKNIILLSLLMAFIFSATPVLSCTSVIISGKASADGRPLMWKNRDADNYQNAIMYFNDGKYSSFGLIDSKDTTGKAVWTGYNTAGFAIMNTASYNLITKDTVQFKDQEGIVMRAALKECATLQDFIAFLDKLPKPMGLQANFGVIDAKGSAAYIEISNFTYKVFDVNDPQVAPNGYLIRTNFSETGQPNTGIGHVRYITAEKEFAKAALAHDLSVRFVLQNMARCFKQSLTHINLKENLWPRPDEQKFININDYITRSYTSASVVVQGIKPGENTALTTLWAIVGFPFTSVVTPLWLCAGNEQPQVVTRNTDFVAPICDKAMTLKKQAFPLPEPYNEQYMNINAIYNKANTGIYQKLKPLDDRIIELATQKLAEWRKMDNFSAEVPKFYKQLDQMILDEYKRLFGI